MPRSSSPSIETRSAAELLADLLVSVIDERVEARIAAALASQASPAASLTTEQVASRTNVTPKTVRQWIDSGALPAIKRGRSWRVSTSDLEEFLSPSAKPREPGLVRLLASLDGKSAPPHRQGVSR